MTRFFSDRIYLCEGDQITAGGFTEKARFAVALGVDQNGIVYDETSGPPITCGDAPWWVWFIIGGLLW